MNMSKRLTLPVLVFLSLLPAFAAKEGAHTYSVANGAERTPLDSTPEPRLWYVDAAMPDDTGDGLSWATACQSIQTAIDKTVDGDVVLVTNGIYNTGIGHTGYGYSRIGITNAITVRSVNGAEGTTIQGVMRFGLSGATRCAFMSAGRLEGFTLEGGSTLSDGGKNQGGGVYALSTNAVVADCVIRDCRASYGGGVHGAAVTNCTLYDNSAAAQGGGAYGGILIDSLIHNNLATAYTVSGTAYGGGAYNSTLLRCRIRGNTARYGGGAAYGALVGCEVKGNLADVLGGYGGGVYSAALTNCVVRGNETSGKGGGAYGGTLVNCTVTQNRAADTRGSYGSLELAGGGTRESTLLNCIVTDNRNSLDYGDDISYGSATHTTTSDPKFRLPDAEDYRLLAGSGCLDNGQTNVNFAAVDFYGNPRVQNDVIDRGALEGAGVLLTDADHLPQNLVASTNLTDGITLSWSPPPAGGAVKYRIVRQDEDAIERIVVSDWIADTTFTDTYHIYGHIDLTYWVVAAFDEGLDTISGLSQPAVGRCLSEIRYVDSSRPDDTGDGASWATAKKTLQAGIGVTPDSGLLLVTNGVYNTGVASETDGKSRIRIAGRITVRSVNGAAATIIQGSGLETFGSSGAVRCVSMTEGRIEGFTLEHGMNDGGGVRATSFLSVIRDCVIRNNSATYGGGAYKGTLVNCAITDNRANYGGGLYNSKARNCTLARNVAQYGGGSSDASLVNCLVRENTAGREGGGTYSGTAVNCILTKNIGGGAHRGTLVNCSIIDNWMLPTTSSGNGGVYGATVVNSILLGNRSAVGELDNVYDSAITYSCSDSVISGIGNLCADPLFRRAEAGDFRLLTGSPCIDAGTSNVNSEVTDLLGHARIQGGAIDIGAVEGDGTLLMDGDTRPQALSATTDQADGITLSWQPPAASGAVRYCVYRAETPTGEKTPVSEWIEAMTFMDSARVYGHTNYTYWVAAAFDEELISVSELCNPATGCRLSPIWYADAARPDDTGDGTSWETACRNIQTAIAKAGDGDLVLVKEGIYDSGVGSGVFGGSRVGIMKPVHVKAAGQAVIRGSGVANYGNGDIRCVAMLDGRLEGFVLEQGCASSRGGAGVYAETRLPQVYGCAIRNNKGYYGGGVHGATLFDCTLSGNVTADSYGTGGGAYGSRLADCALVGNYSGSGGGGGAFKATLENCRVADNRTSGESGGVDGCFAVNCTVTGNRAGGHGGGAGRGKLVNCTILDNISGDIGGAFSAKLVNCILWNNWNAAGTLANFYQGTYFDCAISYSCSYPLATGTGNTKEPPRFLLADAGDYRLLAGSPGVDAGQNSANGLVTDLSGGSRVQNGVIDMGAFEGTATLRDGDEDLVRNVQATTNGTDGITVTWEAPARSGAVRYRVIRMEPDSGICGPVSDWITDLTFTDSSARYGHVGYTYWVVAAYDDASLDTSALSTPAVGSRVTTVWHVDASRPDDSGDGASWATAFKGIQTAITNAVAGDLVLVTNGVYDTGIGDTSIGSSRISITNAITVRSAGGAAQTVIRGSGTNAYGTASAVRCVRMTAGRLEGFTLEDGATSSSSGKNEGGGVFAASSDAVVSDCIIRQCKANAGCGAMRGRFVSSVFENNVGGEGGGLAWGRAVRCRLTGNSVSGGGGGALNATLESCLIVGNVANSGGGTHGCTLFNCTLAGNTTTSGGAVYGGTLANCIVWGNRAPSGSLNNYSGGVFTRSCTTPRPSGTGNIDSDPLFRNADAGDCRILASSPCVDAGDSAFLSAALDLAGNPRVRGAGVDLGAFERTFDTTVATPTFGAVDGTVFGTTLTLTLACETAGAVIHYTTDGTEPTTNSALYSSPLLLTDSTMVRAVACLDDAEDSVVASAMFYRADRLPVFAPADGTGFDDALDVTITTTTEGVTIRYTLDGSDVTVQSPLYETPLHLSASTLVKARLYIENAPASPQVEAAYTQRINGPLDCGNLTFASGGNALWFGQSATTHDGIDAAQSGDIGDSQQSWMTTEVTGPGDLSFWWKVSSESGWDFLRFYIDDIEQLSISGTDADWEQKHVTLSEGTHTLKWSYTKDDSVSRGEDCGWLDEIFWYPLTTATPTSTPADGATFETSIQVSLTCATEDAEIRYTLDGTEPTTESALYAADIELTETTTVKARAYKVGMAASAVASATYTRLVPAATPTFDPADGTTFETSIQVSLACATEDAEIRYTLDGTEPTTESALYAAAIELTATTTVKARAYKDGMTKSAITTATYHLLPRVGTPVFNPVSGTLFTNALQVVITCSTNGATIRYTLDGTEPSVTSAEYSGALRLTQTTTIKAKAYKDGHSGSFVSEALYTRAFTMADAVDAPALPFASGGDVPWFIETAVTHNGGEYAVQSGAISHRQASWIETIVTGAGTLSFWWKVSCEDDEMDDWDYIRVTVDGVEQKRIDGNTDWRQEVLVVTAGEHTVRWTYTKDRVISEGQDCAWLDEVVWTPAAQATLTTPVPVPFEWLNTFALARDGDYEAAALADTDQDGRTAWQEYVAGTCPTNAASRFLAWLTLSNGVPHVFWTPDQGEMRRYTVEGKAALGDAEWASPTNAASRFFRVKVEMP